MFLAVDANIRLAKERGKVEICSYLTRYLTINKYQTPTYSPI